MSDADERITNLFYDAADPQFVKDPSEYFRWLRDEQSGERERCWREAG